MQAVKRYSRNREAPGGDAGGHRSVCVRTCLFA
jgi:hypothetical protein